MAKVNPVNSFFSMSKYSPCLNLSKPFYIQSDEPRQSVIQSSNYISTNQSLINIIMIGINFSSQLYLVVFRFCGVFELNFGL